MEPNKIKYQGSCHCGNIKFSFVSERIEKGLHCNCSLCKRKGTAMTPFTIPPEDIQVEADQNNIGLYQFDDGVAHHYFCKQCGIYPYHQTRIKPGHYRVNLGCVEEIDQFEIPIDVHDGKNQ